VTSPLHSLRIGCVQYLNARPLIHGYDGEVVFRSSVRARPRSRRRPAGRRAGASFRGAARARITISSMVARSPARDRCIASCSPIVGKTGGPPGHRARSGVDVLGAFAEGCCSPNSTASSRSIARNAEAKLLIGNQAIEFSRRRPSAAVAIPRSRRGMAAADRAAIRLRGLGHCLPASPTSAQSRMPSARSRPTALAHLDEIVSSEWLAGCRIFASVTWAGISVTISAKGKKEGPRALPRFCWQSGTSSPAPKPPLRFV